MKKPAIFIDAFINNTEKKTIFDYNVSNFIKNNWDVFIISNKMLNFDKFDNIKYFEYDCNNRLLLNSDKYKLVSNMEWSYQLLYSNGSSPVLYGNTKMHGFTNWTILYNLKKICKVLKQKGYTHLIRCEYDIDFKDYNIMSTIFKDFGKTEKSTFGMGTIGDEKTHIGLVTNFFLINVDYLDSIIPELETEEDYEKFMIKCYGENISPVFELFFYDLIKDDIEIMDQTETFNNINNIGLCASDGGDMRHYCIRKNLLSCPINDHTALLVWNLSHDKHQIIEMKIDGKETIFKMSPRQLSLFGYEFKEFIEVRSETMTSNDKIRFNKGERYNYATFVKS